MNQMFMMFMSTQMGVTNPSDLLNGQVTDRNLIKRKLNIIQGQQTIGNELATGKDDANYKLKAMEEEENVDHNRGGDRLLLWKKNDG
jgi:hypothetical protein